jgi:hypothetical protein
MAYRNARSNLVDVPCEILRESPSGLAWLVMTDSGEKVWLPKSLCEYDDNDGTMAMPEYFAIEKGLV